MRFLDILFSLILIILLFPLFMIIGLLISISEPFKPIIYEGKRIGFNGKTFIMYKFRTLKLNAEKVVGKGLLNENMSLKTPLGKILRFTKLDELPQLFNILNGDMSFIGPRPDRPIRYYNNIKTIKGYETRLRVLPGMSGIAQVEGDYYTPPELKLSWDQSWIENRNIVLYLWYIFKTAIMIGRKIAVKFVPATRLAPWVSVALLITSIIKV